MRFGASGVIGDIPKSRFGKLMVEEARLPWIKELMERKMKIVEASFFRKCGCVLTREKLSLVSYLVYLHGKQSV